MGICSTRICGGGRRFIFFLTLIINVHSKLQYFQQSEATCGRLALHYQNEVV